MNARTQIFEMSLEGRQVDEVVSSIFHTILFHRSVGKFSYTGESKYSIGTVGYTDVDCDFIDFTYVCLSSPSLDRIIRREISTFSEQLRASHHHPHNQQLQQQHHHHHRPYSNDGGLASGGSGGGVATNSGGAGGSNVGSGHISLEFYQRKRNRWPFQPECIPWEVWTVRVDQLQLSNEDQRQVVREQVSEMLTEKIMYITDVMNRPDYVPKMPSRLELDNVFDTTYEDVQPYLFKFKFNTAGPSNASMGSTVKKLIKETLSL